ncbi:MAG: hypothetical protein ACQEQL_02235 [Pseudomonadota bacterium]
MKTLSLKQVFDSIDYTPAPLPEAESHVLGMAQARGILNRFAEDDAAFYVFLMRLKRDDRLPSPEMSMDILHCFNCYTDMRPSREAIELPSQPRAKVTAEGASGKVKKDEFIDLIKNALHCRKVIKKADSPSSPEVVRSLLGLSNNVALAYRMGLNLSDTQFDQIKNLALPVNPVDPQLADFEYLDQLYVDRFLEKKTAAIATFNPRGGIALDWVLD